MKGVTTTVNLPTNEACHTCKGTGGAPGSEFLTCERCHGRGVINDDQGPFAMSSVCPVCQGRGGHFARPVPPVTAPVASPRLVGSTSVFPPGVVDGQRIRLKGKGSPGTNGGPAGDLYVDVHVASDPRFDRRGRNVTTTVKVPLTQAMLGTTVEVPTLDDPVTLKVPAGTQPGTTMRVKGRGVPAYGKNARRRSVGHDQSSRAQEAHPPTARTGGATRELAERGGRGRSRWPVTERSPLHAVYVISVFAELAGVHPQTLRNYERSGLLRPERTSGGSRRFSEEDLVALRRIQDLTTEGVNLEGVKRIMALEAQLDDLRAR